MQYSSLKGLTLMLFEQALLTPAARWCPPLRSSYTNDTPSISITYRLSGVLDEGNRSGQGDRITASCTLAGDIPKDTKDAALSLPRDISVMVNRDLTSQGLSLSCVLDHKYYTQYVPTEDSYKFTNHGELIAACISNRIINTNYGGAADLLLWTAGELLAPNIPERLNAVLIGEGFLSHFNHYCSISIPLAPVNSFKFIVTMFGVAPYEQQNFLSLSNLFYGSHISAYIGQFVKLEWHQIWGIGSSPSLNDFKRIGSPKLSLGYFDHKIEASTHSEIAALWRLAANYTERSINNQFDQTALSKPKKPVVSTHQAVPKLVTS